MIKSPNWWMLATRSTLWSSLICFHRFITWKQLYISKQLNQLLTTPKTICLHEVYLRLTIQGNGHRLARIPF